MLILMQMKGIIVADRNAVLTLDAEKLIVCGDSRECLNLGSCDFGAGRLERLVVYKNPDRVGPTLRWHKHHPYAWQLHSTHGRTLDTRSSVEMR
jgi:hypothetical protein